MTIGRPAARAASIVPDPPWKASLLVALLLIGACIGAGIPSGAELAKTLPTTVGELTFAPRDLTGIMSGTTADDAIIALGKDRDDASIAGGSATNGEMDIVAVAVKGISGPALAAAVATNWPAMTPDEVVTIGEKSVQVLVGPAPERAYVYRQGVVVYVVSAADERLATAAIEALP